MSLLSRLHLSVQRLELYLQKLTATYINNQTHFGLALDTPPTNERLDNGNTQQRSILDQIFSPIDYAVPKFRRSRERRMTRQFGKHQMERYIDIKKSLIMCLECGHWHEKRTICGNCYERVREETKEMKKELGEAMEYTPDQKEVMFVYDGEDKPPTFEGKHIVEMKKPRPKWFADALLTKVKPSNN
ncbi:large subunit ribosomal protein L32 [Mytilus galloprovincialis]|uniref:Large ribosomal subunit protein bL32m n=1 Tax=Mytilus galloprovincialis TaxID=29158 RepID=A0A8B6EPD0_MYTGA|nr:large subunit ribosomal protein L32 [Mytilus galloprovincialis]